MMDVYDLWWLSIAIFAVVIVVVAVLLALILRAAKEIDRHAEDLWAVGKEIAGNTVSIWILDDVNRRLQQMNRSAHRLGESVGAVIEKIEADTGRR